MIVKRIKERFTRETDPHKILLLVEEAGTMCSEELLDFISERPRKVVPQPGT
ncbi:MAG TPA: hypothetical protein VF544_24155 [Pyrinomonadaceae bacterium]|jgi:hypothetical protein